ncbi:MAG: ABC transporter substrate-binding protein [Trueperaceae bacterium]|nr:ABC transporter substrate-binding protein [Trueperaceae bacterium]
MTHPRPVRLALAVLLGLVATAAFAQRVVTVNAVQIFGSIDPAIVSDYTDYMAAVNLYDGLVTIDENGAFVPQLAESWEGNDDATVFTFRLKRGATFHDGSEVLASDVVYSFERLMAIGQGPSYLFTGVLEPGSVVALDDHTVQFSLSQVFSPFMASVPLIFVVNEDEVRANEVDGDWGRAYVAERGVGAGPYRVQSWERGSRLVLERYADYHQGWHEGAIDEVRVLITSDEATIRALAASGDLTMTSQYSAPETYAALDATDRFRIVSQPTGTAFYYKLNTKVAPTDDVHVRRAIACATDYETIREVIFPGEPLAGPLPSAFGDQYLETLEQPVFDLECAAEEVAQSRYAGQGPIPITHAYVAEAAFEADIALLFKATMEPLGFDVTLQPEPWNRLTELATNVETTPNVSQVFFGPTYASPDSMFYTQYHSNAAGTWASMEWLQDPEIDALIDAARATADAAEQNAIYKELQARLVDQQTDVFLLVQTVQHAMDVCLDGFTYLPIQSFDYDWSRYTWTCE